MSERGRKSRLGSDSTRMFRKSGSVTSNLNRSGVSSGETSGSGCHINGGSCVVGICDTTIGVCVVSNNSTKRSSRGVSSNTRRSGYYG